MDKKYLNKVVNRLVSETVMDYDTKVIKFLPFLSSPLPSSTSTFFLTSSHNYTNFYVHCANIYGLTDPEIGYVWGQYTQAIKKIIDIS